MSQTLIRYLLGRTLVYLIAITAVGLAILLLERTVSLTQRVSNWNDAAGVIFSMLANMVPEYLGVAMPAALFFAVLLTFGNLARNSELAVLHSVGLGLRNLMRPLLVFSLLVTLIAAVMIGWLQPYGRYGYRTLMNVVSDASLNVLVRPGTFVHFGRMSLMAESVWPGSGALGKIFVNESKEDGGSAVTTARSGRFTRESGDDGVVLILGDGRRTEFRADGSIVGTLRFDEYRWQVQPGRDWGFRPRGKDERELTITELWQARDSPPYDATPASVVSEIHGRLVRILSIPFLPLLAAPMALGGRRGQNYGLGLGLILLILYEQTLHFLEAVASLGEVSPWTVWVPFLLLAIGSIALFRRANLNTTEEPLGWLFNAVDHVRGRVTDILRRPRRASH